MLCHFHERDILSRCTELVLINCVLINLLVFVLRLMLLSIRLNRDLHHAESLQVDVVDPVGVALDLFLPVLVQRPLEVANVSLLNEVDKGSADLLLLGEGQEGVLPDGVSFDLG